MKAVISCNRLSKDQDQPVKSIKESRVREEKTRNRHVVLYAIKYKDNEQDPKAPLAVVSAHHFRCASATDL